MKIGDLVECAVLKHWGIGIVTRVQIDMCLVRWPSGSLKWFKTFMLEPVKNCP
jgi:hypothetical protein